MNEILCNPNIDPDEYEAEDFESFDSLYHMNDVDRLVDAPEGLYGLDTEGHIAAFLPGGTESGYMNWIYVYMK